MTANDRQDIDWAQVARYLSGELPVAEARALERWFERDPATHQLLAEARAAWEASAAPQGEWDAEAAVQRLREAVAEAAVARPIRVPTFTWPRRRFFPAALAASLAVLGVSSALVWGLWQANGTARGAPPAAMTEVATLRGQRAEVRLPDGSRVTLGVASRIRYPRDFGLGERTVRLEGEAYFDVVHDAARPFRVRAGAGELEDVGTAFVVRAYEGPDVQVVVTEGVVVVRRPAAPGDSVVLTPAQLARVDDRGIVQHTDIDVGRYIAWMRGELVFTDATLAEIAAELSRWYDVDVRVADPAIGARRFTGSFGRQPVEAVVRAIAAAADVAVGRAAGGWDFRAKSPPSGS